MIYPPIRGVDAWGEGRFGAPRGNRTHKGVDLACYKGSRICSLSHGYVSKIGFPYPTDDPKKGHLRYVEVDLDGYRLRYFYIDPKVNVGDFVNPGTVIGVSQGLTDIYKGIIDHIHFEVILADGTYDNPENWL